MYHVPEILRVLQREEAHAIDRQLRRLEIRHDEDPAFADVNELEAAEKHFDHGRPGCRLPQHQACAATGLLDGGMHGGAEIPFQREVRQARAHARGHALLRGRLWLTCAGKEQRNPRRIDPNARFLLASAKLFRIIHYAMFC